MPKFNCVGCVKQGKERVAYILRNVETGNKVKVDRYAMAVLTGRNSIENVNGSLYKDIVIYRGIGCDFSKLPVLKLNEDGSKKTKEQLVQEAKDRKNARIERVKNIEKRKQQKVAQQSKQIVQQAQKPKKKPSLI